MKHLLLFLVSNILWGSTVIAERRSLWSPCIPGFGTFQLIAEEKVLKASLNEQGCTLDDFGNSRPQTIVKREFWEIQLKQTELRTDIHGSYLMFSFAELPELESLRLVTIQEQGISHSRLLKLDDSGSIEAVIPLFQNY